jgi:hypothetical protein
MLVATELDRGEALEHVDGIELRWLVVHPKGEGEIARLP